jgi:hypothetical protein
MTDPQLEQVKRHGDYLRAEVRRKVKLSRSDEGRCPFHDDKQPSFGLFRGHDACWRFKCQACGAGGTVVDYIMADRGLSLPDALAAIEAEFGFTAHKKTNGSSSTPPPEWQPIVPPPFGAPKPDAAFFTGCTAYEYVTADGKLAFYQRRYEATATRRKQFVPLSYGVLNGTAGWYSRAPDAPRPLYRLDALANADADSTVLVVEGEKAVQAAERLFPEASITTWLNGANSIGSADFALLKRFRNVIFWPDADAQGAKAAQAFLAQFPAAKLVDTAGLADGYDCADLEAEGVADCDAWLAARLQDAPEPQPSAPIPGIASPPPPPGAGSSGTHGTPPPQSGLATAIDWMNDRYFVVNEAGRAVVYAPTYDAILGWTYFERLSFDDLEKLYLNQTIATRGRRRTRRNIASVWLSHPDRKQYIGGIVFDPADRAPQPDVLNLWRGFAVVPQQGSWNALYRHIADIICGGDPVLLAYVLDWLADLVQRPGKQSEVTIVLRGEEGCGKGILARAICYLFGQHGLHVTNARHLVGHFNAHLRDCVFLFADEAFYAGDKQHARVLMTLVSEPTLTIEGKYKNAVQTPNFLHIIMASNADWVVPASLHSRRWCVLDVLPNRIGDHAYFAAIDAELKAGGYAAMLHYLMARDISASNLRVTPTTEALREQRTSSLDGCTAWWLDCLHRGYVFQSRLGLEDNFHEWHEWVAVELLYASYLAYCDRHRERYPLHRVLLCKWLSQKIGAESKQKRNAVVGEHIVDATTSTGHSSRIAEPVNVAIARGYLLGTLEMARDAFEKATGLQPDWDAPPVYSAAGAAP